MPATALTQLLACFTYESLEKGSYFLKSGQRCDRLSFVTAGMLRIFVHTDKKEVTQWVVTPGNFVTDLQSLYLATPARWNIQALTNTQVFTLFRSDYEKIGDWLPEWHALEKQFLAKCFITLEARIFSLLAHSAEERYHMLNQQMPELFKLLPQQYLASMLGMTAETFSRLRAKKLS